MLNSVWSVELRVTEQVSECPRAQQGTAAQRNSNKHNNTKDLQNWIQLEWLLQIHDVENNEIRLTFPRTFIFMVLSFKNVLQLLI